MLEGFRGSHARLIAVYWMRFSVRTGGGLMALFLVLTVGLGVAVAVISPLEQVMKAGAEAGHSGQETVATIDEIARSDGVVEVVNWITGDRAQASYLLRDQPALLSAIFLLFLLLFPFTMGLAGFNQTAGEIGNGGLRYLLLRTERANVFLGRFLGAVGFSALSLAITIGVLFLYVAFKFRIYGSGELALWSLQAYVACLLLALPYLAMCAWISGMLDSGFASLALCEVAVGFPILLFFLVDATARGDQSWLQRILPWGWKYDLIHGDVGTRLLAYGMMFFFTGVFLALGLRIFTKRDL